MSKLVLVAGEAKKKRVTLWGLVGTAIAGALTLVGFSFSEDWLALGFESAAHAASEYETKDDADRAHIRIQAQLDSMEDDHRDEMREQTRKIDRVQQSVDRLMGRFGVQPLPEEP